MAILSADEFIAQFRCMREIMAPIDTDGLQTFPVKVEGFKMLVNV